MKDKKAEKCNHIFHKCKPTNITELIRNENYLSNDK